MTKLELQIEAIEKLPVDTVFTPKEVMNTSKTTFRKALNSLIDQGKVAKLEKGKYKRVGTQPTAPRAEKKAESQTQQTKPSEYTVMINGKFLMKCESPDEITEEFNSKDFKVTIDGNIINIKQKVGTKG